MVIDFHTHIFPDTVAQKAIPRLADIIHLVPSMDGTLNGLLASMEEGGISTSVVLPTVTNPLQFDSIIRFADELNSKFIAKGDMRILSFAGIHPDAPDWQEQLNTISHLGFKGIKLHPDYQGTFFNDIRYKRILYRAAELELISLTHTGLDVYSPGIIHCTPEMVLEVIQEVHPQKLVLAHMGCNELYDRTEEKLIGQDIYLDTAYSLSHIEQEQFLRIVRNHGISKILFGTDTPWNSQKEDVQLLSSMPLSQEEKDAILFKNAASLLNL